VNNKPLNVYMQAFSYFLVKGVHTNNYKMIR